MNLIMKVIAGQLHPHTIKK